VRAERLIGSDGLSRRRVSFGIVAEVTRVLPSFVTFLVIPRLLGPGRYGLLAALIAVVALIGALATMGAHIIFVRDVTRDPAASERAAARAFTTSLLGGLVGVVLGIPIALLVFVHVGVATIVLLFAAELLFGNLLHVFSGFAIAREDQVGLALFVAAYAVARMAATVFYAISPARGSLAGFALFNLLAVIAASAASCVIARARGDWHRPAYVPPRPREVADGLAVSSTAAVFYVQDGLDTPIIVRSGYAVDAGNYASAYRVASLAFAPINALVLIGMPRLVTRTGRDEAATRDTVVRLTVIGMAYGLAACVLMVTLAPALPMVLGRGFGPAADMLRWLSLLPFIRACQYFVANLLMLNGLQRSRLIVQLVSAVISVVAYLTLIPLYSWRGAVAGTYLSETALAVGLWLVFTRGFVRTRPEMEKLSNVLAA